MSIPSNLLYTESHEWIHTDEEGQLTVGLTAHAQDALGDIIYLELPVIGTVFSTGEPCATVESVKAASDIYAPVAGTIVAVNDAARESPETINGAPYETWLFKIVPESGADTGRLMSTAAYEAAIG